MKTRIYKTYGEFLKREDINENGVSEEFAERFPEFEKMNSSNSRCYDCYGCSDCSGCYGCSDCSGCSGCYGCSDCSRCSGCSGCSGCSDCYGCSGCSGCSDCYDCSGCSDCFDCEDTAPADGFVTPKIPDIHQKLLQATSQPNALNMDAWHTCETTHCRAGWVVHLAGAEGKALEERTSTLFAAMQIYHKSSKIEVSLVRFFEDNKKAMEDIKRCAELEAKQ